MNKITQSTSGEKGRDITTPVSRLMYALLVLVAAYFLFSREYDSAMSNLGIALIFDPFDPKVSWPDRPLYQRVWLGVHVAVVFGLLIMLIVGKLGLA